MPRQLAFAVSLLALLAGSSTAEEGLVPQVEANLALRIEQVLAKENGETMKALALAKRVPAMFRTPVRTAAIDSPWSGLKQLEKHGLSLADERTRGVARLPSLIKQLSHTIGKPIEWSADGAGDEHVAQLATLEAYAERVVAVFDKSRATQRKAFAKIPDKQRPFMMAWPKTTVHTFGPQLPFNAKTHPILQNDRAFCAFAYQYSDWEKLLSSTRMLLTLGQLEHRQELLRLMEKTKPVSTMIEGAEGDILFAKETPHGLIILGGRGKNTYDLHQPVALLADLGGDDTYRGMIAASTDDKHTNSVVVDFSGDDTYEGAELGLATGRLGVGLLVDVEGDDKYKLKQGSGGVGFGGVGVLCDLDGDDQYSGSKFTQGVGLAGIGLLYDSAGNDTHTSFGYAVGFAGPAGVGAVLDIKGADSYQCGRKYPSGYNSSGVKPEDPKFQYTAFGLGMGLGRRILSKDAQHHAYALAGGVGMLVDLEGDDRYASSNFSQGCGYFFGVGLKLDLAGEDVHMAARYGHAAGAHFGLGLFADYEGADQYGSTGPTYNGGCAWDHSAFMFIGGGRGKDRYDWSKTSGMGRADIGSWAVFAELGGDDQYISSGPARTSKTGVGVFLDANGNDDYSQLGGWGDEKPVNNKSLRTVPGGFFTDQ